MRLEDVLNKGPLYAVFSDNIKGMAMAMMCLSHRIAISAHVDAFTEVECRSYVEEDRRLFVRLAVLMECDEIRIWDEREEGTYVFRNIAGVLEFDRFVEALPG